MPLRLKLLIAVIVLVFIGLAVSNVVTYTSLHSFLVKRVDQQLTALKEKVQTGFACFFIVGPFKRGIDNELILPVSEPRLIEQRGTERRCNA